MNNKAVHTLLPFAPLVARILVGGMFLLGGIQKITGFAGMVAFAQSAGLPSPEILITLAIIIEVLGGLSVIFGYRIFWGALALAVFTVVVSFIFHADFTDTVQQMFFIKNMGIVAALLYMVRFGAGRFSVEE